MARRPIIQGGARIASAPPAIAAIEDRSSIPLSQRKQDDFTKSLDGRKPKSERRIYTRAKFNDRVKQAKAMLASGEWENAGAQHFVALYAILHEMVYGIAPLELNDATRTKAVMMASQCLHKHFDGDASMMAMFMDYVWTKEKGREKWRRDNKKEGGRITWYLQFGGSLITDFRANRIRKGQPI